MGGLAVFWPTTSGRWKAAHPTRRTRSTKSEQAQLQQLLPGAVSATQLATQLRTTISLTSKERNVLKLVAEGKSNKEMAKLLGITPETIKSHMKNIFAKLNVDSRAQAAVAAKASGFI
ncbi:helix-turn-helix transcriptional regulator [Pseudomonas sp. PDM31]|uniref:response regulator transcription factor n=1 Tax=Pseudomonas sp. PDM31 TaxID=2854778 RepID=UPI001C439601|nr:helix-turn-helix transcriptional regulator [Pseudomonas sp. PDM31]